MTTVGARAVCSARAQDNRQSPGHRRIARQGQHHRPLPGRRLRGRVLDRPRPRPAPERRRRPRPLQGVALGASWHRRRQRVQAALRAVAGQAAPDQEAEGPAGNGRGPVPCDRRGPRGRGDRLAPVSGAEPAGRHGREAHGVSRDHPTCDRGGARRPAQHRPPAGRLAGGAPHPGPPVRLRGVAGAVEEGPAAPVGRPRAERRHPHRRRARARADGVRGGPLLEPHRRLQRAGSGGGRAAGGRRATGLRRDARLPGRQAGGRRLQLHAGRRAQARRRRTPRRGGRARPDRRAPGDRVPRAERGPQALSAPPGGSVHDLHVPAGSRPQAAHPGHRGDARGADAVREGLHHLHAHRQHHPLADRIAGRPPRHRRAIRRRLPAAIAAPLRQEGQERPGSP